MKTKSLLNRKLQLAFASAIVALLVVGALCYRAMVVSSESDRWVGHTHEVLESLDNLVSSMRSVESNYRAFVITGNEAYAKVCLDGIERSKRAEASIASLTSDNPNQQRRIPDLERLASEKFQRAEQVLDLRRTTGLDATAKSISDGEGTRIMAEFQAVVGQMQDE